MIDIRSVPVLDNHSHFFKIKNNVTPLVSSLTLSLNNMPLEQLRHTLMYQDMLSCLSKMLSIPFDENSILSQRRLLMESNYQKFVDTLFNDANIRWMIIDIGLEKSSVDFSEFEKLCPAKVSYVYRSESMVDMLWKQQIPIDIAIKELRKDIEIANKTLKFVAIKSIIGYRTGLQINPNINIDKMDERNEKSYRDILFLETAKICRQMEIPLHIHAAFGESNLDVRENNPLHLKPFLESSNGKGFPIVLIHGGYPYTFEAGYLAAMYPNLYVDISEFIPFASMGMQRGVEDILSMCPTTKIMYGSDGFDIPETHWYAAISAKKTILSIVNGLIESNRISHSYGERMIHHILYENSMNLHGIY
jgi:hypothetical protein